MAAATSSVAKRDVFVDSSAQPSVLSYRYDVHLCQYNIPLEFTTVLIAGTSHYTSSMPTYYDSASQAHNDASSAISIVARLSRPPTRRL